MQVELKCQSCTNDYELDELMIPIGPLTIAEDKTQCQEYKCNTCYTLIKVCINTVQK